MDSTEKKADYESTVNTDLERLASQHQGQVQNVHLEGLVLQNEDTRNMSGLETISAGWIICNSWAGIAATFALAISQGGPVTLIYGPIIMCLLVGACAVSLAELASVYPTAGGQYHWVSILAPEKWSRGLSYWCGATNVFSWIAICAGIAIIIPQLCLGMAIFWNPTYVPQTWHAFLVYQAANVLVLVYNIYLLRRTMWVHDLAFFVSIASFLVIVITSLARTAPHFQPTESVWTTFLNESGWSNGIAFLTGLVSPNYMYAGIDGAVHLAEECKNPGVVVPRALMSTVSIGFVTSFIFAIIMMYCTNDIEAVVTTTTGVPVFEIWRQATRSDAVATVFLVLLLLAATFALNATHQTASRLTWSFARDDALFGSRWLGKINERQQVPIAALLFNFAIMFIIGCIYLGSTSAFNAFIGTGLILQHVTYAFPAILLMMRKRSTKWLPESRSFKVPSLLGWAANLTTVGFAVLVLIFYDFPTIIPVTGTSMNYASAVIGVMAICTIANWFGHARKHFRGPRLQVMWE
ncbi:amino acid/polyamine transporter I [Boeremia exigua]|uniref:amino acid/polyamine transporter I n=1 Tax=Boeremia exigua TaxID=749465 RepID=UPI001E8EB018|nr:amino acid/polyamine transporter I [Boeremia exigua]KAH6632978.1 amino acid/polyamine transporter I [Boeremia exigua]